MAEELLDCSNVLAALEEVGREGVAERVAACPLGKACEADCDGDGALDDGLVEVMAALLLGLGM